ncbi:hypothetical protein FEQ05_06797 [Burkholderia pseudomultivorans]|uniref:Uncharacterized protein n=1 Tax=Burkholderia pseudomultivorans TaxID=1207504 RepID=A0A6P2NA18_9BURK|nr:hypothetical protein [Burkholderia pseudomultivorans]MDR8851984.1 hypothetical protein [Burkholderia pseudomultivorans]VWB91233.1 hypothetical protein BPS26883_04394 [Burkholderia pseudomultivorans]
MLGSAWRSFGPLSGGTVAASSSTSRAATISTVAAARGSSASAARPARCTWPPLSTSMNGSSGHCHSCNGTAGSRGGNETINVLKSSSPEWRRYS